MRLQTVTIDSMKGKKWEWIILYRQKFTFKHTFKDDELNRICGVFQPPDVEILEVYGRVIRFSLIRHTRQLFINVMFAVKYSVQVFLESIRTQQKAVIIFSNSYHPPPPIRKKKNHKKFYYSNVASACRQPSCCNSKFRGKIGHKFRRIICQTIRRMNRSKTTRRTVRKTTRTIRSL